VLVRYVGLKTFALLEGADFDYLGLAIVDGALAVTTPFRIVAARQLNRRAKASSRLRLEKLLRQLADAAEFWFISQTGRSNRVCVPLPHAPFTHGIRPALMSETSGARAAIRYTKSK
jgi:hypothetical protein